MEIMAVTFVGEFATRGKKPLEIEALSPMYSIKQLEFMIPSLDFSPFDKTGITL